MLTGSTVQSETKCHANAMETNEITIRWCEWNINVRIHTHLGQRQSNERTHAHQYTQQHNTPVQNTPLTRAHSCIYTWTRITTTQLPLARVTLIERAPICCFCLFLLLLFWNGEQTLCLPVCIRACVCVCVCKGIWNWIHACMCCVCCCFSAEFEEKLNRSKNVVKTGTNIHTHQGFEL